MKQFTLKLKKETQRPTVLLEGFYHFEAMVDTGSVFPVWVENVTIPDTESEVRNLVISDKEGRLHIACNSAG